MEYDKKLISNVNLINDALKNIGTRCLSENSDFVIDSELHFPNYVKYSIKKLNSVDLDIVISTFSIHVNIEKMNEVFEWGEKKLVENREEIVKFFEALLTGEIHIEYCGSNYRKISLIDQSGDCVKTCKYVTGLYLRVRCSTKKFHAIYAKR